VRPGNHEGKRGKKERREGKLKPVGTRMGVLKDNKRQNVGSGVLEAAPALRQNPPQIRSQGHKVFLGGLGGENPKAQFFGGGL